ncbi:hypothetical protein TRFO_10912 [Tritrichomonas foetus]|uniref:Uncharacterized protein n=1 Tax=Tritrichomonas foetus TaxID=1144522 RepID=A0A1J4J6A0_9EUKA|nr:hypothetical protein TRFO_10912 [Tritrichomonas foetus]|eukprot:OHS94750.1 hypothetical protein TRFO_10912 [Tritrichomonas foetus]
MLRILDSPNELLSMIVSFLNNKDDNVDKIKSLINESTTSKLVPAFAFLGNWLVTNISSSGEEKLPKIQLVLQLIGMISLKVPPVILLTGAFDLNWGMYQPHWLLRGFYAPINERIIQLRSYIKPFSIYGQIVPFLPSIQLPSNYNIFSNNSNNPNMVNSHSNPNLTNNFNQTASKNYNSTFNFPYFGPNNLKAGKMKNTNLPGLVLELENDPSFQAAIFIHFKRLILNHAPLDVFKPLMNHRNSRTVLTNAIIDLIKDLNNARDATQEQLVFAFSLIFLYVHAFSLANQIDGQALSEFLQSRPYLSPFCILAMINHIPVNMYLFNLLTPKELLIQNDVQLHEIKPSQYIMVDLSTNDTLDNFVSKMPTILSNYFLSTGPAFENEACNKKSDNDFLSFLHLSSATLYNKMKAVLSVARERPLGPLHVSSMGILLLRCITFSLQRTLGDCAETKMFTDNFCGFVKTVFAILSPAFADQLGVKFFDIVHRQSKLADLTIRGAFSHLFPVLLHHSTNEHLIPFCVHSAKEAEIQNSARLMISKLLQCERVKLNPKIIESLKNSDDALILLEYIDAIPDTTLIETCEAYEDLMKVRKELMQKLRINPLLQSRNLFIIESVDCGPTQPILYSIDNMTTHTAAKDASNLLKQYSDSLQVVLRMLSMTNFLQNRDFSSLLVTKIQTMLANDSYSEEFGKSRFELRQCEFALPIAQAILGRLLLASHTDLAGELLNSMSDLLIHDSAPLHWLTSFSLRFRYILPKSMLQTFDRIASELPCADSLYKKSSNYSNPSDLIFDIAKMLVERDMVLVQDPDIINREYQSPYEHAQAFAHCSLAFSQYSDDQIADMLTEPIFGLGRAWHKRDLACLCLAKLTTTMNSEVSYKFFLLLMERKSCEMALLAGRLFLMNTRIDVFKMVCQNCQSMIRKDNGKLDFFMRMVMPSFSRLKGDDAIATSLLCGFLESITEDAPRVLQESVIDAVGLVYVRMKLYKSRPTLINAAVNFTPELKGIIASSLETTHDELNIDAKKAQYVIAAAQKQKFGKNKKH